MNIKIRRQSRLVFFLMLVVAKQAFAQDDNPTGNAGMFNGNSHTACSYDPYTANATRSIIDVDVAGAVGAYPLRWVRTMNSRMTLGPFGSGGGWTHSYNWNAIAASGVPNRPSSYTINYPDGRVIVFSPSAEATIYHGPLGVGDRLQTANGIGECYLILTDGGKVHFHQVATLDSGVYDFNLSPVEIIDPNGLVTALTYDTQLRLIQVTEPAGRWLKISYTSGRLSLVKGGHTIGGVDTITQSAAYSYGTFGSYSVLAGVTYENGSTASYTYQASNMTQPQAATPVFNPTAGAYPTSDYPKNITVSTSTTGAYMSYTTNGTTPSSSNGTIIGPNSGTASVPAGATLKAIAYLTGYLDSAVASGVYTALPPCATPTFNPVAGAYPASNYPKTITISTTTTGTNIRWTTNGSNPTHTNGTLIAGSSGSATVPANTTLRAIAYKTGMSDSPIASGLYSIQGQVVQVVIHDPGDVYPSSKSVTMTTTTTGATIFYTTSQTAFVTPTHSGATPTGSTLTYSGAISIPKNQYRYLSAIGYKSGLLDSVLTQQFVENTDPNGGFVTMTQPLTYIPYPLIRTCSDVRYPGPMKMIGYDFVQGGFYGQLSAERYYDGTTVGAAVATLTISSNTRTEKRGDGNITRVFTYGATPQGGSFTSYLLASFTDFKGKTTSLGYDAKGFINKVTDANAHITSFTKAPYTGNLLSITHPPDEVGTLSSVQYTYTDQNTAYYLDQVMDELGHITTYHPGGAHMTVPQITYPDGGFEIYSYNAYNQILTHQNTSGGVETYTYDTGGRGLLINYTPAPTTSDLNPAAHPTIYGYDANDHLHTVTDPNTKVTTVTYDSLGRLTTLQHPLPNNSPTSWLYNPDSTLQKVTDGLGHFTSYTYDNYKRLRTVTTPQRGNGDLTTPVTSFWYNEAGSEADDYTHVDSNVWRTKLPSLKIIKAIYDNNFWKTSVTASAANGTTDAATTQFGYDFVGNVTSVTDPRTKVTSYQYDPRDRLKWVDSPLVTSEHNSLNHTTNYGYDLASNVKSVRRTNDQVITNDTFDNMNRVTQRSVQQSTSLNAVTKYAYYQSGLLHTMQDPKLVADSSTYAYTYSYDAMGRQENLVYPPDSASTQRTESWTYDIAGNVNTFTNRGGAVETFTYDERNRLKTASWSSGDQGIGNIVYDNASRMTSITTAAGVIASTVSRAYYNDNLLYTETQTVAGNPARTITYTYDLDSNRAGTTYPDGTAFSYGYTGRNQLDNISAGSVQWVKYLYDAGGNRTHRKLNNSLTDTRYDLATPDNPAGGADALNRIHLISTAFTTGGTATFNYTFDSVSRLNYEQRNGGANTSDSYGYDLADQITAFNRDGTAGSLTGGAETMTLQFDANGNRTNTTDYGVPKSYVINALNQYTQDMNGSETHDVKGNLQTAVLNGTSWTYTYDAQNRLTRALATGTDVRYYYDAFGRQTGRELNGARTYSVWDGWSLIQEYDNSGTALANNYLQGAGTDEMVARFGGTGNRIWYYQDGRGNTSHIAGDTGNLIESYTYGLGGNPFFWNSSGGSLSSSSVGNRFLYSGRDYSSETTLYDLRNRFYNSSTSRFLQSDPIGFAGGSNLYGYCGNSQANAADPFGLEGDNGGDSGDDDTGSNRKKHKGQDGYMPPDPVDTGDGLQYPDWGLHGDSDGSDSLTQGILNGGSPSPSNAPGTSSPSYIARSSSVSIWASSGTSVSYAGGGLNGGTHGGFTGSGGSRFDARTERSIATLIPQVQILARLHMILAHQAGLDMRIIDGSRTFAEQNDLYSKGRTRPGNIVTNARGGQSNHNFGIAYDIGIFDGSTYIQDGPQYDIAGMLGMSIGLQWGGVWSGRLVDRPHFQYNPILPWY